VWALGTRNTQLDPSSRFLGKNLEEFFTVSASGEIYAEISGTNSPDAEFIHHVASRITSASPVDEVLARVVQFAAAIVSCDSCFVYTLEGDQLVLRSSMNPHPEAVGLLRLRVGQGITGWVAAHLQPVAIARNAFEDPRFQFFNDLPEDRYEAFLSVPVLCRGRLVGVINVQHRSQHAHTAREIRLLSTIGLLAGAEIEMARLESENSQLSDQLETRKMVERAKGILQRDLSLTEEQAYLMLRRRSRQNRKSMKEMAGAVISADLAKRKA
jgi:uroporphyrinogen-III synthase